MSSCKINTSYLAPNVGLVYPNPVYYIFKAKGALLRGASIPVKAFDYRTARMKFFRMLLSKPRKRHVTEFDERMYLESVGVDCYSESSMEAYLGCNGKRKCKDVLNRLDGRRK